MTVKLDGPWHVVTGFNYKRMVIGVCEGKGCRDHPNTSLSPYRSLADAAQAAVRLAHQTKVDCEFVLEKKCAMLPQLKEQFDHSIEAAKVLILMAEGPSKKLPKGVGFVP